MDPSISSSPTYATESVPDNSSTGTEGSPPSPSTTASVSGQWSIADIDENGCTDGTLTFVMTGPSTFSGYGTARDHFNDDRAEGPSYFFTVEGVVIEDSSFTRIEWVCECQEPYMTWKLQGIMTGDGKTISGPYHRVAGEAEDGYGAYVRK